MKATPNLPPDELLRRQRKEQLKNALNKAKKHKNDIVIRYAKKKAKKKKKEDEDSEESDSTDSSSSSSPYSSSSNASVSDPDLSSSSSSTLSSSESEYTSSSSSSDVLDFHRIHNLKRKRKSGKNKKLPPSKRRKIH